MNQFQRFSTIILVLIEVKSLNSILKPNKSIADAANKSIRKRAISPAILDVERQTTKWNSKNITYKISEYTQQLAKKFVDEELGKAFGLWEEHIDLTFIKVEGDEEVDIEIKFCIGEHGDSTPFRPFDMAHAFAPQEGLGGDIHFNDNYTHWHEGTTLLHSAAHEIGHALGLNHVPLKFSIMSPYQGNADFPVYLALEDIQAVQALYGKKPSKGRLRPPPPIRIETVIQRGKSQFIPSTTLPPKIFLEKDAIELGPIFVENTRTVVVEMTDLEPSSTTLPTIIVPETVNVPIGQPSGTYPPMETTESLTPVLEGFPPIATTDSLKPIQTTENLYSVTVRSPPIATTENLVPTETTENFTSIKGGFLSNATVEIVTPILELSMPTTATENVTPILELSPPITTTENVTPIVELSPPITTTENVTPILELSPPISTAESTTPNLDLSPAITNKEIVTAISEVSPTLATTNNLTTIFEGSGEGELSGDENFFGDDEPEEDKEYTEPSLNPENEADETVENSTMFQDYDIVLDDVTSHTINESSGNYSTSPNTGQSFKLTFQMYLIVLPLFRYFRQRIVS